MSVATSKPKLNPRTFPRPPAIEKTSRHLEVRWHGQLIAETTDGYWVLETHHPPTYYLPPAAIKVSLLPSTHSSFCEWKGRATYHNLAVPGKPAETVKNRIWSYGDPTDRFRGIKDYLCFYAGPWDCFVDGEKVEPQPGDFYGGWMTSDIERSTVKGGPGTWGW